MIPMKKESKTICFNDFAQAVSYLDDTEVGLFVTSLERNGDGESLGVLIVIVQLAPASFHAMLDDGHAEPGAAGIFLCLFAPEERFGDVLHFLGGDAGAAVADFHGPPAALRQWRWGRLPRHNARRCAPRWRAPVRGSLRPPRP